MAQSTYCTVQRNPLERIKSACFTLVAISADLWAILLTEITGRFCNQMLTVIFSFNSVLQPAVSKCLDDAINSNITWLTAKFRSAIKLSQTLPHRMVPNPWLQTTPTIMLSALMSNHLHFKKGSWTISLLAKIMRLNFLREKLETSSDSFCLQKSKGPGNVPQYDLDYSVSLKNTIICSVYYHAHTWIIFFNNTTTLFHQWYSPYS